MSGEDLVGYPEYSALTRKTLTFHPPVIGTIDTSKENGNDWSHKRYLSVLLVALVKEIFCTMILTFAVLAFVSQTTGSEPIVKKFIVGLVYLLGYYLCYSLGNVRGVPRHCNLAYTTFEYLNGRVPLLNYFVIYLGGGAIGSILSACIAYTLSNVATEPLVSVIGSTHGTSVPGAFGVIVIASMVITLFIGHLTSYLQEGSATLRLEHRPLIAAVSAGATVAVTYASFGVFNLDSWTYFAGCLATSFSGPSSVNSCWNQDGTPYGAGNGIGGIGALWMLAPMIGGFLAWIVDWSVARLENMHNFTAAPAAHIADEQQPAAAAKRSTVGNNKRNPNAAPLINNKIW